MPKILVYTRRFSKELFQEIINKTFKNADITFYSDFKNSGDIWTGKYIYDSKYDVPNAELQDQMSDIICRDRVLRNTLKNKAPMLVTRLWNGIDELLSKEHFDYFFTLSIDCYTIDVLLRLCDKYNVKAISFLGSFISGYAWFTLRGERNLLKRNVSEEEAQKVFNQLIQKNYLPDSETKHVRQSHKDIFIFYYRRKLIEVLFYPFLKCIFRDPLNYHFNMCNLNGKKLSDFYNKKYETYFTHIKNLQIDPENTIYLPMHFIPEATTDYWCDNIAKVGYNNYILNIIKNTSPDILFLIKEHPAMYGKRELSFYEKLLQFSNVKIIHPLDSSNNLLELVKTVVVDNGTVGVEAVLRGKRVISLSRSYYADLHPNIICSDTISKELLQQPITDYDNSIFIKELLDGLFHSNYKNDKKQSKCSSDQISEGLSLLLKANSWNDEN